MAKGETGKVLLFGAGWSQSLRGLATWYNLHCLVTQTQRAILLYLFISKGIYTHIFLNIYLIYIKPFQPFLSTVEWHPELSCFPVILTNIHL